MPARHRRWSVLCATLALVSAPGLLRAQESVRPPESAGTAEEVLAGLGMGVAGLFGGWIAGGLAEFVGRKVVSQPCPPKQFCETGEAIGLATGVTLGVPLGVHLANHKRGSFWRAAAGSVGAAALLVPTGLYLFRNRSGDAQQNLTIWPTIAAQVTLSVIIENRTSPPAPVPAPKPPASPGP